MLGTEGVSRALVYRLLERFPSKMSEIRNRLALEPGELPDIAEIYPHEIPLVAVNAYPCIAVVTYETTGRLGNRQMESDGDFDEYSYRYRMRVFVWGMADNHVETDLLRKRITLAAREVLLNDKIFYDQGGQYAELDPQTLKESYSDIGDFTDSQFLGGAYLEFEVSTQETLKAYQGRVSDDPATIIPEFGAVGEGDTHPVPQPNP